MQKINNDSRYDLLVDQSKIKSCFNFVNDMEVGAAGENFVNKIFGDDKIKLEIKKDDWTIKSSNLALEFESRGKPSGILTTQADFYCFVVGHFFVLMLPVDFLLQVYKKYINIPSYIKNVGDRDKTGKPTAKVILLPWNELLGLFKQYEPFTTN